MMHYSKKTNRRENGSDSSYPKVAPTQFVAGSIPCISEDVHGMHSCIYVHIEHFAPHVRIGSMETFVVEVACKRQGAVFGVSIVGGAAAHLFDQQAYHPRTQRVVENGPLQHLFRVYILYLMDWI